jgi:hypothetical protein
MTAPEILCTTTRNSAGCGHPVQDHTGSGSPQRDCPCCTWQKSGDGPTVTPSGTAPKPPPADMPPFEQEKWAAMSRVQRRAVVREYRKATRKR